MKQKKYLTALLGLCMAETAGAQTLTQAKNFFEQGEFEKAKPVFERLVKQSPSNASYNFWYGACCYETGESEKAYTYLSKSAKRRYIDAYLYLGKWCYDAYRFDEAEENLNEYIDLRSRKKGSTEDGERMLEKVRRGQRMIRGVEKVAVIDSFVVDKQDFLKAYKLSADAGDIRITENGVQFTNEMGDKQLQSVRNAEGQASLYSSMKMIDQWSKPEAVTSINELGNADYPFVAGDGITMYYASDNEESMGGYDIFVTRYDSDDNSYLRPDNLGMPFNSPANDYMYVIDDLNNLGWFVSDRRQPEGKVCVYVFVPNASKQVYDYENGDPDQIAALARLDRISDTCTDEDKVRTARQQLAALVYSRDENTRKADFTFIVDDSATYHSLRDFRSAEARKQFQMLQQKEKDLESLIGQLDKKREAYAQAAESNRANMAPGMLDMEKRVEQLRQDIEELTNTVRNTEIRQLRK
ncbi:MAG: CDC27 family protein [Phocaeicola sp.]|nr:CDC27 family protein [Phocaeicola sp.]